MSARSHIARLVCALACTATLAACGAAPEASPTSSETTNEEAQETTQPQETPEAPEQADEKSEAAMQTITITVNGQSFEAELEDSDCGRAFAEMLPLWLDMSELNGNEKYCYLDEPLPSAPEAVGHIEAGDIMLFGDDCVVVFYDSFETQYSYTRIGSLGLPNDGDLERLREALGAGDVTCELWVEWSE